MDREEPKLRRLPLRCMPQPDESLSGFILRLAERNGMDWPSEIMKPAGIRLRSLPVFFPSPAQLEALGLLSGVPADKLALMCAERNQNGAPRPSVRLRGVEFPRDWLCSERKACPRCLREAPYHRLQWDLRHSRVCVLHACALIHTCPDCAQKLDWGRSVLTRCRCGRDLSTSTAAEYDTNLLGGAAWISGTILEKGGRPPRMLAQLSFVRAVEITVMMGAMLLGTWKVDALDPLNMAGQNCLAAGYRALDGGIDELEDAVAPAFNKPFGQEFGHSGSLLSEVLALCSPKSNPSLAAIAALLDVHFGRIRDRVLHALAMHSEKGKDDAGPMPGAV